MDLQIYLVLLADDAVDMECNCINPTPRPPTAPASNPSNISTGIFSRGERFFLNLILFPPRPWSKEPPRFVADKDSTAVEIFPRWWQNAVHEKPVLRRKRWEKVKAGKK